MFSKTDSASQRLANWREFRQNFPEHGTVDMVVQAFASSFVHKRFIDYYTPASWPNVFEIVQDGLLCQSGLTLVMASTMHHLKLMKSAQADLIVISNYVTGHEGLVLRIHGNYINFLPGKIVTEEFALDNSTIFDKHIIAIDKLYS